MRRPLFILSAVILVLGLGGYAGWRAYQKHLTGDLKRTLVAAADPTASLDDIHAYLRSSRLLVKTQKDREVQGKFEMVVALTEHSQETQSKVWRETLEESTRDNDDFRRLGEEPVGSEAWLAMVKSNKDSWDIEKIEEESREHESARAEEEAARAKQMYVEVRAELGLPPLKD